MKATTRQHADLRGIFCRVLLLLCLLSPQSVTQAKSVSVPKKNSVQINTYQPAAKPQQSDLQEKRFPEKFQVNQFCDSAESAASYDVKLSSCITYVYDNVATAMPRKFQSLESLRSPPAK